MPTEGRDKLARLFEDCTALFQARPGKWKGTPIDIELKEGARPQHSPPYRIPQAHMKALRKEIDRLVQLGVLSPVKEAEWASPTFCIPKKDHTIRLLHDFRRVNKMIKRKPFPLPRIQDTTQQVGTFNFASCLDLNMGYYSMMLNRKAKQICTIVIPWGLYEYNALPMGISIATDVFQARLAGLFSHLPFVLVYIDGIAIITKGNLKYYFEKVEMVLKILLESGMQVNPRRCI